MKNIHEILKNYGVEIPADKKHIKIRKIIFNYLIFPLVIDRIL